MFKISKSYKYVVAGQTGEYGDRRDWTVCMFSSKAEADKVSKFLNSQCLLLGFQPSGNDRVKTWDMPDDTINKMKKLDPDFDVDYTGTSYDVWKIPVGKIT